MEKSCLDFPGALECFDNIEKSCLDFPGALKYFDCLDSSGTFGCSCFSCFAFLIFFMVCLADTDAIITKKKKSFLKYMVQNYVEIVLFVSFCFLRVPPIVPLFCNETSCQRSFVMKLRANVLCPVCPFHVTFCYQPFARKFHADVLQETSRRRFVWHEISYKTDLISHVSFGTKFHTKQI